VKQRKSCKDSESVKEDCLPQVGERPLRLGYAWGDSRSLFGLALLFVIEGLMFYTQVADQILPYFPRTTLSAISPGRARSLRRETNRPLSYRQRLRQAAPNIILSSDARAVASSSGVTRIQLTFDRCFVPKERGINEDTRKLVIRLPKTEALRANEDDP
jgi:hypothetical protein